MNDPFKFIEVLKDAIKLIFGNTAPPWIFKLLGYVIVFGVVLMALWGALFVMDKIRQLLAENLWPAFYNADKTRRTHRRKRFADHIESEMRRLNSLEQWSDYRFAELEAEVEAEGRRRLPFTHSFFQKRSTLRREKSLSQALERSKERLILLEGDPGAGKSVALRHVVQQMARRAMRSRNANTVIPVYVNLRELERKNDDSIDRDLICAFVLKALNRFNDRDIEEFLEQEFDIGLREGTWFFLFDSFDEIPGILSSVGADKPIREYAQAIADFLGGMNQCRGVVASRQFRGPGQLGWPRFRVLTLSEERQRELIRRADLTRKVESQLFSDLVGAPSEIRAMANNPMFLGLLCEQTRTGHMFPTTAHTVFETYLETRLTRDADRLERRFKLRPKQVREVAETIAFCMASDPKLGLSPARSHLKESLTEYGSAPLSDLDTLMDALEFIKLARPGTSEAGADTRTFTFAHRRFQEYFATCVVLRDFTRVSPTELLTNGRWRETAVVLCQTQAVDHLAPIIEQFATSLSDMAAATAELPRNAEELFRQIEPAMQDTAEPLSQSTSKPRAPFSWPRGALHILGILQEGFGSRARELPEIIQVSAGRLLVAASGTGILPDRKWALEVAGTVQPAVLVWLLRIGFAFPSQWLRDVAYGQTARLPDLPRDIASSLRKALVQMAARGRISREWLATVAHLSRLERHQNFLSVAVLLRFLRPVDATLNMLLAICILSIFKHHIWTVLLYLCVQVVAFNLLFAQPRNLLYELIRKRPAAYNFSALDSLMAAMFRLFLLAGPLKALGQFHSHKAYLIFVVATYVYASMWAPFSVLAAASGEFVFPLWWPLMPVWPLLYLSRKTEARLKELVLMAKRHYAFLLSQCILLPLIILMIKALEKFPLLRIIAGAIFFGALLAGFGWPITSYTRLLLLDWLYWRRWKKREISSIDVTELGSMLASLRTVRFKVYVLQTVYRLGLLSSSVGAEEKLIAQLTELHKEKPRETDYAVVEGLSKLLEQLRATAD